ncbi:hypothetical protein ABK040_006587 [Willaertia magna]
MNKNFNETKRYYYHNVDYNQQESDRIVNAFIISHSHCDPGWLETVDYYSKYNVSKILDNVVQYLSSDPNKRFVWSESVYLEMWWKERNDTIHELFKSLVKSGRIQIVGGGWVMNDEACPTYDSIINQMTEGHQFIKQNIGIDTPITTGYQIDPFGASKTFVHLLKEMGLKYHIMNRVDDRLKHVYSKMVDSGTYIKEQFFEFYWCDDNYEFGKNINLQNDCIFTHIFDHHYSPPEICDDNDGNCYGYDFESDPKYNPFITNENIYQRASDLVDYIRNVSLYYRNNNNLLIPFGNDFRFQRADLMFNNMDKLINYINNNKQIFNVNIKYSTIEEYFNTIFDKEHLVNYPIKTLQNDLQYPDYFPYDTCWGSDHDEFGDCIAYWSGFFTSEPQFKQLVRKSDEFLRSAEIIYALTNAELYLVDLNLNRNIDNEMSIAYNAIESLRRANALALHHDAITGTEKRSVLADYTFKINFAMENVKQNISKLVNYLLLKSQNEQVTSFIIDENLILNENSDIYPILLFNSLASSRNEYIDIKIPNKNFVIYVKDLQTNNITKVTSDLIEINTNEYKIYFNAILPPLGFNTYFLVNETAATTTFNFIKNNNNSPTTTTLQSTITMENNFIQLQFELSKENTLPYQLKQITNKITGIITPITQQLLQYTSYGDGAYIFRPYGIAEEIQIEPNYLSYDFHDGKLVKILKQRYTNNITQSFILYNEEDNPENGVFFEMEITSQIGNDNIQTQLFTDSNGYEMIKRQSNVIRFNDTNLFNKISGNYYPMVESSFIRGINQDLQLTVLSRQALGISSLSNGSLEVMMNRNSLVDDNRGLDQNLNVSQPITTRLRIMINSVSDSESLRMKMSKQFNNFPLVLKSPLSVLMNSKKSDLTTTIQKIEKYSDQYLTYFRSINELPSNVHLLSLQVRKNIPPNGETNTVMRLQNLFEKSQSLIHSKPVTLYFKSLFNYYFISDIKQYTLSLLDITNDFSNSTVIILKAKEIKTLVFKLWKMNQGDTWFSVSSFLFGAAGVTLLLIIVVLGVAIGVHCKKSHENHHEDLTYSEETNAIQVAHFERDDYESR